MKAGIWSNSQQARELLARQQVSWPAARAGYRELEKVEVKVCHIGGLAIKVQYNPARIISSGAKTDAQSLRKRPCFLCPAHLPPEQEGLPMGNKYLLLCNPYPIFPEHFTIAARRHVEQHIRYRFTDFLTAARQLSDFTLFYNGPQSGASAPDHLHFQAVTRSYMPIDEEAGLHRGERLLEEAGAAIYLLTGYLRNGFILEAETEEGAYALFKRLYKTLRYCVNGETEPRMNLFCRYEDSRWQLAVIPRAVHRPRQYYAEGADHVLTAPGAADTGGVFITARREDFEKMTPELLLDIYQQIAFPDSHISYLAEYLLKH
ncbi:MAG: DUF4922 domain-containing protein [Tannerellaceae bacterium]|jgi:hypothetical protein|nr:DUF4922 domain-containing protein [Tannerellaceae bacterium]